MTSKTEELASRDKPLRWIELVPENGIAIVHRELVVEIVVAFAHGQDGGDEMIPRRKSVVVRGGSQIMCDGVQGESAL